MLKIFMAVSRPGARGRKGRLHLSKESRSAFRAVNLLREIVNILLDVIQVRESLLLEHMMTPRLDSMRKARDRGLSGMETARKICY
jgi:hypothetical protein